MVIQLKTMSFKYLEVIHTCATILCTVLGGYLCGRLQILEFELFVPQTVNFVFHVALPCLVVVGLGININFYEEEYIWSYIGSFFLLRACTLFISFFIWYITRKVKGRDSLDIGHVAVIWLTISWISTVILGAPILGVLFGNNSKGISYGILAAVSSFAFQLPLQLVILEYHELQKQTIQTQGPIVQCTHVHANHVILLTPNTHSEHNISEEPLQTQQQNICSKVVYKLVQNPVLWSIVIGFVLSLSTFGPSYLKQPSVYGNWLTSLFSWLGATVSPLSLFTMGVWLSSQHFSPANSLPSCSVGIILSCMALKLVVVPLLMVGITKLFRLNDEAGRAAVLISCLPISMAGFTLGSQYEIGESILSMNVIIGTLLILPTVLMWNVLMDTIGLYNEYSTT